MQRSTRDLLLAAAGCAGLFALLLAAAYVPGPARWLDAAALEGFFAVEADSLERFTAAAVHLGDPAEVGLIGVALAAIALARGRARVALLILLLLAATSVSSQVLKALLAHPRDALLIDAYVSPRAFPSGHATAAMSLALAAVLAAPRRARPAAAVIGAGLALVVGLSVVSLGWHFPSDVVGGYLLATGWALVLVAGLRAIDSRTQSPARPAALARIVERASERGLALGAVATASLAVLAAATAILTRSSAVADFASEHTAAMVVGAAIFASAVALPAALAIALRGGAVPAEPGGRARARRRGRAP